MDFATPKMMTRRREKTSFDLYFQTCLISKNTLAYKSEDCLRGALRAVDIPREKSKRNNAYLAGKFSLSEITARLRAALLCVRCSFVAAEIER